MGFRSDPPFSRASTSPNGTRSVWAEVMTNHSVIENLRILDRHKQSTGKHPVSSKQNATDVSTELQEKGRLVGKTTLESLCLTGIM